MTDDDTVENDDDATDPGYITISDNCDNNTFTDCRFVALSNPAQCRRTPILPAW